MKNLSKKAIIRIIIIAAAAAAAIIVVFLFMTRSEYYEKRFFPNTYINGWDASNLTATEMKADLQAQLNGYKLTIEKKDGSSEEITGVQLGLKYVDDNAVDEILEAQDGSQWLSHISKTEEFTVDVDFTYDESAVTKAVDSLECTNAANVTASENAYVELTDSGFTIVPEVEGNEVDKEKLCEAVEKAVEEGTESINLKEAGLYVEPSVKKDDQALIDSMNTCNQMISAQITYDFVDSQWVVDKDELISWLVQNEDGTYTLNYDSVYEWVHNMAYETDTFGLSHKFMTSYGVEVQLEGGGDYGWCIDKDLTTQHLYEYLTAGTVATVEPDYLFTAMDRSSNDIGGTYVEICISTQTMWFYYEGELLVETPVVTGNVSTGHATPSGSVWAIDAMKTDWKFRPYANAYSDYWMPFNDQVGIHDASWQPWGSSTVDTYLTAGSHGCVNTPLDAVRTIYEHVQIGTPVIVYYSVDQVHGPDPTADLEPGA